MPEIDAYDYDLPTHLIAQQPLAHRADARLLVVDRARQSWEHKYIRDLPDLFTQDDCLVLNDTRVVPARLVGFRTQTGGRWEGLFLAEGPNGLWQVLSKTRGKLQSGETVTLVDPKGNEDLKIIMLVKGPEGEWAARPESNEPTTTILERVGRVPLPPYIRRGEMVQSDRERYQTVFARNPGAIAAPTAGLHFTESLFVRLENLAVTVCHITLHVGLGTFRPIETDSLDEHPMHDEWANLDESTVKSILASRDKGRVIAVGTTSMRVLETAASGGSLHPFTGKTDLFIRPPFKFHAVNALLTNFHLPRSTLLVLVRTFGGDKLIRQAYEEAIREEYRFYSYGDAMLIF